MKLTEEAFIKMDNEVRDYFKKRGKNPRTPYTFFYSKNNNTKDPFEVPVICRNYFCDVINRVTYNTDVKKYDKYILEHIAPMLRKYRVSYVILTFGFDNQKFTFPPDARDIQYRIQ